MPLGINIDFIKVGNCQRNFLVRKLAVLIKVSDNLAVLVQFLNNECQCAFRFFLRYTAFHCLRDCQIAKVT